MPNKIFFIALCLATACAAQTAPAPAAPAWHVRAIENGGHEAFLHGVAESAGKRSAAVLAVSCTLLHDPGKPPTSATVNYQLRIPRAAVTFPTDDLSCFGDGGGNNFARIRLGNEPAKEGGFCYDGQLPQTANQPVEMQIVPNDDKVALRSPGGLLQVALRLPNTTQDAMLASFQLPLDATALDTTTRACFQILDEAARKEKAAVVVACPEVPGKPLQNVSVLMGPAMTKLAPNPDDDIGIAWDVSKKGAKKATLACYYGTGPQAEKKLLPIPPTAAYCVFRKDGHCSTSEGHN